MATNWSLAGNGFGNALATGLQLGQGIRQRRLEDEQRATMAQDRAQAQQRQQQEQRRADLPFVGRLLSSVRDEDTYQRARGVAQQYGIDLSNAPQTYDPQWIEAQKATIQSLSSPEAQQALTTTAKELVDAGYKYGTPEFQQQLRARLSAGDTKYVPLAPGGGLAGIAPGQAAQLVIAPNTGGMPAGAPVAGQPAASPTVKQINGKTFYNYNGKWYDEPMGGGGSNVTGNFPGP